MPILIPATPQQIAAFGDVAAKIRAAMAAKDWRPGDLNKAIGKPSGYTGSYGWMNGKGAPGPMYRAKVAKALGLKPSDLVPRATIKAGGTREVVVAPPPKQHTPATAPVLAFTVTDDGAARLRLDITTPVARGVALLRLLLDAGLAVTSQESE